MIDIIVKTLRLPRKLENKLHRAAFERACFVVLASEPCFASESARMLDCRYLNMSIETLEFKQKRC